jgi:hypothetical protein
MALCPSFSSDAEKLLALGHKGFVYPLDEALEIAKLPFRMTLPAMRIIAKEAVYGLIRTRRLSVSFENIPL